MRGRSSGKTAPPVPGLTRVGGGGYKLIRLQRAPRGLLAQLPARKARSRLPLLLLDAPLRHLAGDLGDLPLARLGELPLALLGSR